MGAYVGPSAVVEALLTDVLPAARTCPGRRVWMAGRQEVLRAPCVAIVGTRRPSARGAARARRLARELVAEGVTVVSGLAAGIDTEAMTAAMAAGGRVVGVIGTPLDQASPAENARLQEAVHREHLLLSQFPSGARVQPGNFPARNKVMAAVADATVVVEAAEASGTRHQADECLRLNRWLFFMQSMLEDPSVRWPAEFLSATRCEVLTSTMDVLRVLSLGPSLD